MQLLNYPAFFRECNCNKEGHTNPFNDAEAAPKLEMVKINTWKKDQLNLITPHFEGADAVVSCLGHRQPGWKNPELKKKGLIAYNGSKQVTFCYLFLLVLNENMQSQISVLLKCCCKQVIAAASKAKVDRVVAISSISINGDKSWPHLASKAMVRYYNHVYMVL